MKEMRMYLLYSYTKTPDFLLFWNTLREDDEIDEISGFFPVPFILL